MGIQKNDSESVNPPPALLNRSDWEELYERRLEEKLISRIEMELKRRYTWLFLVVAFITGSGITLLVRTTLSDATAQLEVATYIGKSAEEKLKELSKALTDVKDTQLRIKELEDQAIPSPFRQGHGHG